MAPADLATRMLNTRRRTSPWRGRLAWAWPDRPGFPRNPATVATRPLWTDGPPAGSGVLDEGPSRRPTNARFIFLDPHATEFFRDWDKIANDTVALRRAEAGRDPTTGSCRT
jgi:hypothetical protein